MAILLALVGRATGYDAANPGAFLGIMTALLFIISASGFLTITNASFNMPILDKYIITLVSGMFFGGLVLSMIRRQTQ